MKPRHIVVLALFILINVIVMSVLMMGGGEEEESTEAKVVIPYLEAQKVENRTEQFDLVSYGTVSSFKSVAVSCEVQGKLIEGISLKPGVKFKQGQLLFRVNDTEARYNIRSRKSTFINLIANMLPDIKVDYSSEYDKWKNYMSSIRLDESIPPLPMWKNTKEKVFLSTRNVLTEYFAIKSQEETLKKYHVYAPFSGMITEVFLNDYSVVNPGAQVIKIVETGNYEIPVPVPVSRLDLLGVGSQAKIYTTSGMYKGVGEVVRVSEVIDKNTQSVSVYVKPVLDDSTSFVEGEYVKVSLAETGEYTGIRIPHAALRESEVLVYKKDSTLEAKVITVLDQNESGIFISGLKDNQIVVTQEVAAYTDSTKFGIVLK